MRRVVIALTSSAVAACSWSLSGFSGAEDSQPVPDATALDGATSDASSTDGATTPDGGRQGCRDRPLSKTLLFCDDFDDPNEKVGAKWNLPPAGTVSGSPNLALSAPAAMQANLPALTDTYGYAHLRTGVTVEAAKALTYRFALYAESLGMVSGGGYLSFAAMRFTDSACPTQSGTNSRRVELSIADSGDVEIFVVGLGAECHSGAGDDTAGTYASFSFTAASAARWTIVTLRAATAPCPGKTGSSSITLMLDDAPVGCAPVAVDPMQKLAGFSVDLGISNGKPWGDTTLDFDDVEITVE